MMVWSPIFCISFPGNLVAAYLAGIKAIFFTGQL
jgi:hypothetical protein